jgi:hypothetical protein
MIEQVIFTCGRGFKRPVCLAVHIKMSLNYAGDKVYLMVSYVDDNGRPFKNILKCTKDDLTTAQILDEKQKRAVFTALNEQGNNFR